MAADMKTLAQMVMINDENLSGNVVEELLLDAPLVRVMSAQPSSASTQHKWLQYTEAPVAAFRDLNEGIAVTHSVDTAVSQDLKILDASHTCDTAAASGYRYGVEAFLQREAMRHLQIGFAHLERQVINGTAGSSLSDSAGFEGLTDSLAALSNGMVVNAADTLNLTSVYLLRTNETDASLVTGNDGNISVAPAVRQRIAGETSGYLGAYFQEICSWYCYQHGGTYSGARIANIDSTGAKVTDDLIAQAISLFPATRQPNLIVMNRASLRQLRENRTATNQTGAPAPFPADVYGIPIVLTDQIANDETALT